MIKKNIILLTLSIILIIPGCKYPGHKLIKYTQTEYYDSITGCIYEIDETGAKKPNGKNINFEANFVDNNYQISYTSYKKGVILCKNLL